MTYETFAITPKIVSKYLIITALQTTIFRERRVTGDGSEVDEHGQEDQESDEPSAAPGTEGHRGEGEEVDAVEGEIPQSAAAEDQSSQTHEVEQCIPLDMRRI